MSPIDDPAAPPDATLRTLFDQALALPAGQRAAFLDRHCADPALRARLDRLLAADAELDAGATLTDRPALRLAEDIGESPPPPAWSPGQRIGAYELLEVLGEGGSSTVFRAIREEHGARRQVALKLLHRGLYSPEAERLFRREHRALASLSHPNIAHLIDGGVSADGHPYLVMEQVDGVPVTEYAARHQLGVRERLRLLAVVCRAVAAAHRALIVHRDLKPSNILVDGQGQVKLLDFGIAKLLDQEQALEDATRTGYAPLTPGYAAPEQYAGEAISTATDVYALGVVLHELLLGERPARQPAQRPSARVAELATDLWALPAPRPALRTALRGDLDTIVLKALAEEPERRYASAAELADDLDRHLDHQPVRAHPPSRWYRTRKFVQRHRGGVLATAALAAALVASLALALWQAALARQQSRIAQAQSQRAEAVSAFLIDLFDNQIPARPGEATPGTDELLERGVQRALEGLDDSPGLQGSLLLALARVYDHLARGEQARPLLQAALAAARRAEPADPALLAQVLSEYGALEFQLGHYAEARTWLDQALALQEGAGHDPLKRAVSLDRRALAASWLGDHQAALQDYHEALALRLARLPPDHPEILHSRHAIGSALIRGGRAAEALPWVEAAVAGAGAVFGDLHVKTAHYRKSLAILQVTMGHLEAGIATLERAVAAERTLYPPDHPDRGNGLSNLGFNLWLAGRLEEARATLDEGLALLHDAGQGRSIGVGFMLGHRARVHEANGQWQPAREDLAAAMAITAERLGPEHARTLDLRLQQMRLDVLAGGRGPAAAQALLAHAERLLAEPDLLAQYRVRGLAEAGHARALALDRLGRPADAAEARRENLARAADGHLDALVLADVAALAGWLADQDERRQALTLLDDWLTRSAARMPEAHYARGELHLVAAELNPETAARARHLDLARRAFAQLPATHTWQRRLDALSPRA